MQPDLKESRERFERITAMFAVCEGIPTEALERLTEAGGVLGVLEQVEKVCDGDSQGEYVLADILKAIGPLEDAGAPPEDAYSLQAWDDPYAEHTDISPAGGG